jgi:alanine-glyoxylate transaminase/serine-glyoxylate transaminase/serine-pyruvate transaminase
MDTQYRDLNTSQRLLLGAGPSLVHPRVLRVMATPLIGHLDPQFISLMNELQELLRVVFESSNAITIPISGTGSAGMEAALCNFIEEGDPVLICVNGYFGERLTDIALRYRADVRRIDEQWGEAFSAKQVKKALEKNPAKLVAIVHAETSTGVLQPLEEIADVVHKYGALLLVDAVTSLGGISVGMDSVGIDIAYSGSQKCLSAPPGLAPVAISPRAADVMRSRKTPVANWYLDMTLLLKYWGPERAYHHTAPISLNYALREALRLVEEEGLSARFQRHSRNAEMLWEGLTAMGLRLHVPFDYRLTTLTTVRVPEGLDEAEVRRRLLEEYNIEIAGGLGTGKGKLWRIGLMGYSSKPANVFALLGALESILA